MKRLLWTAASAGIWALAAATISVFLTVPTGVFASVIGTLAALPAARRLAASPLRLVALWVATALAASILVLAAHFVTGTAFIPALLGPEGAYVMRELMTWLIGPFLVVCLLRASSLRHHTFVALEITAMTAVFAGAFAAHRSGFINRPYLLVDPLWARGYDPVPVFLAIGAAIAGALVFMAASRSRRSFSDVILICALLGGIFLAFPISKLKDVPPASGGVSGQQKETSDQKSASGQKGSAGQGSGSGAQGPMSSFANLSSGSTNGPVAVVLFHDDYDSPLGYYYFRQAAFSQFNGQRLIQDTSGEADGDVAASFPSGTANLAVAQGGQQQAKKFFRPLDTTVALMIEHARPFLLVNALSLSPRANPDPKRFERAYDARSSVLVGGLPELAELRPGSTSWSPATWKHYTESPSDPRYAALAGQIAGTLKPEYQSMPVAHALAIKMWLDKNGTYSLESRHEGTADPVADFLFGDRVGHCVFFAHAACLLMRAGGIPARVGTGYAVDGRNRGEGSSVLVREKDAHAWPEIYLEGLGWIPFDIAPEKSLARPADAPDQGLQQMLGVMVRQGPGNPKYEQRPPSQGDVQELFKQVARTAGILLMIGLAALVVFLYITKLYRRIAPYVCRTRHLPRVAYRASLDRLADSGHARRFGQTREAFALSVAGLSASFVDLTAIHLREALGGGSPAAEAASCLNLYRGAIRETARSTPWWRLFLGALDPTSWLRVK